jgi:hypothetical protein
MATATLTVARVAGAKWRFTLSNVPARPADFDVYEFRVGRIVAGATAGNDAIDGSPSGVTAQVIWDDPDSKVRLSAGSNLITEFDIAANFKNGVLFSSVGVVYYVVVAMRDKSDNYSAVKLMKQFTVKTLT